ncbi:MAG: serine protease [Syntrophobacteraceae bacterium]
MKTTYCLLMTATVVTLLASAPAFSESPSQQEAKKLEIQTAQKAPSKTVVEAIESVRHSMVQIAVKLEPSQMKGPGSPIRPLGSGFFIDSEGYVITARHVIHPDLTIALNQLRVGLPMTSFGESQAKFTFTGSFQLVPVEVVDEDEKHDLALLKVLQNPFKNQVRPMISVDGKDITPLIVSVSSVDPQRPKDGTQIAISGYPLPGQELITNVGYIASSQGITQVQVPIPNAPPGFTIIDILDVYYADVRVNHGNSGGPVYSVETGKIIGVAVAMNIAVVELQGGKPYITPDTHVPPYYNAGIALVVPIQYVLDLARKHNVSIQQ